MLEYVTEPMNQVDAEVIDLSYNKIIPAQLLKIDNPQCKEIIVTNNPGVLCQTLEKLRNENLTVE